MINHEKIMKKGGFKIVKRRRRGRVSRNRYNKSHSRVNVCPAVFETEKFLKGEFIRDMVRFRKIINMNMDIEKVRNHVFSRFDCEEIVCYGIGDLLSSDSSKVQFCLLDMLTRRRNDDLQPKIFIYDPVIPRNCKRQAFEDFKRFLYERYNMNWITENENCKRRAKGKTLFYIPHGDLWMYENVVKTNSEHLNQVRILGNDFSAYEERKKRFRELIRKSSHQQRSIVVNGKIEFKFGLNDFYSHTFG